MSIRKLVEQKKVTFMGLVETKHRNSLRCDLFGVMMNMTYVKSLLVIRMVVG